MRVTTLQRKESAHEDHIWVAKWIQNRRDEGAHAKDLKLLTGSCDETCNFWSYDDSTGFTKDVQSTGQDLGVISLDVNSAGEVAATSTLDCCIRLLSLKPSISVIDTIKLSAPETWSIAFHPDPSVEQLAVAAGCLGGLRLYKSCVLDEGVKREICHLKPQPNQIAKHNQTPFALGVAYDPSGTKVAVSHSDGHIALYDVQTQKHILTYAGHSKPVKGLSFSPDGSFLISACDDKTCNLYDISSKLPIGSLNGHESPVLCIEKSGQEGYCFTGSGDGVVKVWDLRNRSCVQTIAEHKEAVWSLALHEGANRLASVSEDKSICVYQVNPQ